MRFTNKFSRLVNKDLKNKSPLTEDEVMILNSDLDGWLEVLKDFKGEVEVQFTYLKKVRAEQELKLMSYEIEQIEFDSWLVEFHERRLNAARLLKSIEAKLVDVKYERKRKAAQHIPDQANADQGANLVSNAEVSGS